MFAPIYLDCFCKCLLLGKSLLEFYFLKSMLNVRDVCSLANLRRDFIFLNRHGIFLIIVSFYMEHFFIFLVAHFIGYFHERQIIRY